MIKFDPVTKARSELLLDSQPTAAFLATLAMQLHLIPSPAVETMQTDGTCIWWNPEFVASLTSKQLHAVLAHEVLHCGLLHVFRRGNRDPHLFNIAADHVVNNELTTWGFQLPPDCYCDPQYKGLSVEDVYAKLWSAQKVSQPQPQQQGKSGAGNPQPGGSGASSSKPGSKPQLGPGDATGAAPGAASDGLPQPGTNHLPGCPTGSFQDPPPPSVWGSAGPSEIKPMTAEDWSILAEQAAMAARMAGTMPGDASTLIKAAREVKTDWREETREFVIQSIPSGQTWARPHRRFLAQGMYLPGPLRERVGKLVVIQDASGSMWGPLLQVCSDHINSIVQEVQPESVTVVYVDTAVRGVEEFEPGDEVRLNIKGGGGTYFQPGLDYLEQMEEPPVAALYLTDMENGDWGRLREPTVCPVLWVTPKWVTAQPEFGRAVRVDVE